MKLKQIILRYIVVATLCFLIISLFFLTQFIDHQEKKNLDEKKLTREILDESLDLGTQFILNNQKDEGNFNYEYDFVNKQMNLDDNEVRQAGALWGLSLIYNDKANENLVPHIKKGFDFFNNYSKESEDGKKWIIYPNSEYGRTGTIALVTLSIIDFLRSAENIDDEFKNELETNLDKYLNFLVSLRLENGQFYQSYNHTTGVGYGSPSPYFDGESLLALTKAAKYMNKSDLVPLILESAVTMYNVNVVDALQIYIDSATTKGFFQWGCMSYFEIFTSGWNDTEQYSNIVIELAEWMIDIHDTLNRTRNTGYAYEGIIHAYELTRRANDDYHTEKFAWVIDEGLYKLTSWQVGGPIQNDYLLNHTTSDKLAIGGVMNHKEEPFLRIDVTQHQMHAVILARRYVYL